MVAHECHHLAVGGETLLTRAHGGIQKQAVGGLALEAVGKIHLAELVELEGVVEQAVVVGGDP